MIDYFDGSSLLTCNFAFVYHAIVMMMTIAGIQQQIDSINNNKAIEKSCEKSWQSEQ